MVAHVPLHLGPDDGNVCHCLSDVNRRLFEILICSTRLSELTLDTQQYSDDSDVSILIGNRNSYNSTKQTLPALCVVTTLQNSKTYKNSKFSQSVSIRGVQ